jgi:hypothetical protein
MGVPAFTASPTFTVMLPQQAVVGSQPFPLRGGLITIADWRLMATSGALTSRLPTIKASSESGLRV